MVTVMFCEPPLSAKGWVVWPSDAPAGFQCASIEHYDRSHARRPRQLSEPELKLAIAAAQTAARGAPADHMIYVVVA